MFSSGSSLVSAVLLFTVLSLRSNAVAVGLHRPDCADVLALEEDDSVEDHVSLFQTSLKSHTVPHDADQVVVQDQSVRIPWVDRHFIHRPRIFWGVLAATCAVSCVLSCALCCHFVKRRGVTTPCKAAVAAVLDGKYKLGDIINTDILSEKLSHAPMISPNVLGLACRNACLAGIAPVCATVLAPTLRKGLCATVEMENLLRWGVDAVLDVRSPQGSKLLQARVSLIDDGLRELSVGLADCLADPVLRFQSKRGQRPVSLEVYRSDGEVFGTMELAGKNNMMLKCEDHPVMSVSMRSPSSPADLTITAISMDDGSVLGGTCHDDAGNDHDGRGVLDIRVQQGADWVLVTACFLAMVALGRVDTTTSNDHSHLPVVPPGSVERRGLL